MGLLALNCLPTKRPQWECYHPTIWRKVHWFLTVVTLVAFGFALPLLPGSLRPYYVCAIGFLVLECITEQCRQTAISVNVSERGKYLRIEAPINQRFCNVGVFYYLRGKPFPASSSIKSKNVIVVDPNDFPKDSDKNFVLVEGPYGPSIGILWWIGQWISQAINIVMRSGNDRSIERRPPQLITTRQFRFVVDDTAFARTFPLWLSLRKSSADAVFYYCDLSASNQGAYEDFLEENGDLNLGAPFQFESFAGAGEQKLSDRRSQSLDNSPKVTSRAPGIGLQNSMLDMRQMSIFQRLSITLDLQSPTLVS